MSERTSRRAAEPAHVVATKNLADVYVKHGGKRAEFFEKHAKRHGFENWNAYRKSGRVSLNLYADNGGPIRLSPGCIAAEPKAFLGAAMLLTAAAVKEGYRCDASAPFIISDDLTKFVSLGPVGGLVLRAGFQNRTFMFMDDIPGTALMDILIDRLQGHSGLIILDLPGVGREDAERVFQSCPNSIILHASQAANEAGCFRLIKEGQLTLGSLGERTQTLLHPKPRVLGEDMWGDRAFSMLQAFAQSGVPYDTKGKPDVSDVDPSHPVMLRFLRSIPGYIDWQPRRQDGRPAVQDSKTREQFSFLTMQI